MLEEYRICKVAINVGGFADANGDVASKDLGIVEQYEVQVKGMFFWHTIKTFKKIRQAVRLYHYLKDLQE